MTKTCDSCKLMNICKYAEQMQKFKTASDKLVEENDLKGILEEVVIKCAYYQSSNMRIVPKDSIVLHDVTYSAPSGIETPKVTFEATEVLGTDKTSLVGEDGESRTISTTTKIRKPRK